MSEKKRRLLQVVVAVLLVAVGVLAMRVLTATKPELEKRKPITPTPVVRTVKVKVETQPVNIRGEGTVRPLREITLVPEVGGKVVHTSPSMVNGGTFSKDDTLLRIAPVDYELAVSLAQAQVKDAESKLQLAEELAAASREEWSLLHRAGGSEVDGEPPPLVAKEPQLAAAAARLEAGRADLRKALLNLERTELKAPFNGRVSQENVDIGQYVAPGQSLATLYSTEVAEIVLPLEDEDLFWFYVPGFTPGDHPGSPAVVRARIAGRELSWPGEVVRAEGELDERTRMVNVVVRVERPYAKKPPLPVGLFVTVEIKGRTLPTAALIPRASLHQGDVVWVVGNDGRLYFRKVAVARVQGQDVLIKSGLNDGEMVVITPLKAVTDGMAVRTIPVNEGDQ
ncbi:MAG: efflux RND transporter periplasmic adaptor subunit [Deltaproteobacteria bacterium]|nr:efflux RND transporter periplasmic adaptor subunit [Deltaproteobacteria bacterium]